MFRYLAMIMLPLFILSMAVQYNDPDPIQWMIIYLIPAIYTVLAIRRNNHWTALPLTLIYLLGTLYWMPGTPIENPANLLTDVKMVNLGVEEWREDGGLLICTGWFALQSLMWLLTRNRTKYTAVTPQPQAEQA